MHPNWGLNVHSFAWKIRNYSSLKYWSRSTRLGMDVQNSTIATVLGKIKPFGERLQILILKIIHSLLYFDENHKQFKHFGPSSKVLCSVNYVDTVYVDSYFAPLDQSGWRFWTFLTFSQVEVAILNNDVWLNFWSDL